MIMESKDLKIKYILKLTRYFNTKFNTFITPFDEHSNSL
jgi:hypothetical protein